MGCTGGSERAPSRPQELVLHPRDLARGYEYGDDSACGRIYSTEGEWPKLEPLFREERPDSCSNELQWVWAGEPKYSRGVDSAAYVFRDEAGARRAYQARDELATWTGSLDVDTREPLKLGAEAELLRGEGLNNPASGVVWRDENVVAVVIVEPADDDVARELAAKQQRRIDHPSPPREVGNDPELQLDDPTLNLPVYWLGRSFDPPGALPPLELELANVGGNGPGQSIQLWYRGGVTLDGWKPDDWARFRHTRLGRLIWDSPCARKKVVRVESGRAEIFHGFGDSRPVERPCPQRPPSRVLGHVYYKDIVVAVNMPYCYTCAEPTTSNPYNTVAAMETVVHSLRLRTRRR